MNNNNNNFSLIRNGEINRIGPYFISPMFYEKFKINEHMKTLDAYEDEHFINCNSKIWERDEPYEHKYCNKIVNVDYNKQYCLIGIDSLLLNKERINHLYNDTTNDFYLLDNKCSISHLQFLLDMNGFSRFKCYSLIDKEDTILEKYFMLQYKSCDNYEIINNLIKKPKYISSNFSERHYIINYVSKPSDKYLEIGVETGYTFNNVHFNDKTGVDPSPIFSSENLVLKTSDDYFKNLHTDTVFDIIFIDGMHQAEYVLNDLNNSIRYLSENGLVLLDDIIPLNVDEQFKVPVKYTYEDNILKTLIPWTGDVWKVLFHILCFYSEHIQFRYFYNLNHRGVCVLEIKEKFYIPESDIEKINNYDYVNDFITYIELIKQKSV